MANKQETKKRRVAAANQAARQQAVAAKAERRKRLLVGGVVGFLALALIAPLTAGLLVGDDDGDESAPTTTFGGIPWVTDGAAGAELTGPTPCPATDGTAERTTEFAEPPPMCIEAGDAFDLTFDTAAGSFTVPVDSTVNAEVANLAAVLGWYRAYEQTPVAAATGGLLLIGSAGDAGFTLPVAPPTDPIDELYPVGSVVAIPGLDGGITGTLVVVLDDAGAQLLRTDPRYVPVGTIDDLTELQTVYDASESDELLLIESVLVEPVA
ncbi:MAG: hypothetical protein RIB98_19600 [Acidimicrobiales bacterium]